MKKPPPTRPVRAASAPNPRAERRVLDRLDPLDEAIELVYYGSLGTTRDADDYLSHYGFSQAHHRVMYILARQDGINVGDLMKVLGISKQAAQRPIKQLVDGGFIAVSRDPVHHRCKVMRLSKRGREIEDRASSLKRAVVKRAFGADTAAKEMWLRVMRVIADNA